MTAMARTVFLERKKDEGVLEVAITANAHAIRVSTITIDHVNDVAIIRKTIALAVKTKFMSRHYHNFFLRVIME